MTLSIDSYPTADVPAPLIRRCQELWAQVWPDSYADIDAQHAEKLAFFRR